MGSVNEIHRRVSNAAGEQKFVLHHVMLQLSELCPPSTPQCDREDCSRSGRSSGGRRCLGIHTWTT